MEKGINILQYGLLI